MKKEILLCNELFTGKYQKKSIKKQKKIKSIIKHLKALLINFRHQMIYLTSNIQKSLN